MTHTSCVGAAIKWRLVPAALFVCLLATPAVAQIAQATIDRIVELTVQRYEASFLWSTDQVDRSVWIERRDAIEQELKPLLQQVRALDKDQQQRVNSQITGLTEARLALAKPLWQAKRDAFQREREERHRALMAGIMSDAQKALEPQRHRLLLQERRERGEITAEEFAAEDKQALDDVMELRNKYVEAGGGYDRRFDTELARLTREMAKPQSPRPAAPEAVARTPQVPRLGPQAKTPDSPTSNQAYVNDVGEIGHQLWLQMELERRFKAGEMGVGIFNPANKDFDTNIQRSVNKWRAAGRGDEFERDYRAVAEAWRAAAQAEKEQAMRAWLIGLAGSALFSVVAVGGIYLLVRVIRLLSRKQPEQRRIVSDVHGTAHYAPVQLDIVDEACLAKGIFFGKSSSPELVRLPLDAPGAPVCSTPEHHALIVARTRTGKGTRVIVPTLLRYGGSAFVIDPKGENAAVTARIRRDQLGQNIHILNPWDELHDAYAGRGFVRATYNPLDILDRNDPNVVAIAQTLAANICPVPAGSKESFWVGSAGGMLQGVFLWLTDQAGERKTLARAREIVSLSRKDLREKFLIPMAASEGFAGAIREMAAPFIDLAPETYSGVMANLAECTRFLSDPQVKAATASSSFSMEDLVARKTTVYIVIPTDRMETQKTWLRLVIAAAMHTFKRSKTPARSRHRCLFLIDEFAALGRVDDLPRDIASMGGHGVDFALVVQGLDQLKDHYGEAKGTILSNCAYKWFCDVNDLESAKYLSDTLGKATVSTSSSSASSSAGPGGASSSQSTTYSETGRSLLNPDEVLNLRKNVAIAIQPNGHPQYLRPVDYWNLPLAFASLQEGHPNLYWNPPLTYDPNPYVATDEIEVHELSVGEELGQDSRAR